MVHSVGKHLLPVLVFLNFSCSGFALAAEVELYGKVTDIAGVPIEVLEVAAYRGGRLIAKAYTEGGGSYHLMVEEGPPICVLFDTHPTLNNAMKWHPSVVMSVEATKQTVLNRTLVNVGRTGGEQADLDALFGYQFAAYAMELTPKQGRHDYAKNARGRLGMLKLTGDVLGPMLTNLDNYFAAQKE